MLFCYRVQEHLNYATATTSPLPPNGNQQQASVMIAGQSVVVSGGGIPISGNNGSAMTTGALVADGGSSSSTSPPVVAAASPNRSPSTISTGAGMNGVRSSPASGGSSVSKPSILTGNTEDYQTYTMSRIITEALERSNVGCTTSLSASSSPTAPATAVAPVKTEVINVPSNINNNNHGTPVPPSSTAAVKDEPGSGGVSAGQKRSNEEMEESTTKQGVAGNMSEATESTSGASAEDQNRVNSEQQASKRMKVET